MTPDERMLSVVMAADVGETAADHIDLSQLDREQLPVYITLLRNAENHARQLRGLIECELTGAARSCPVCGTAVAGRADRVYCGATCRQRARRAER